MTCSYNSHEEGREEDALCHSPETRSVLGRLEGPHLLPSSRPQEERSAPPPPPGGAPAPWPAPPRPATPPPGWAWSGGGRISTQSPAPGTSRLAGIVRPLGTAGSATRTYPPLMARLYRTGFHPVWPISGHPSTSTSHHIKATGISYKAQAWCQPSFLSFVNPKSQ